MLSAMSEDDLASRLLDAQVAWLVGRLTGPDLEALVAADVDDLLATGERLTVASLLTAEDAKRVIHLVVAKMPASTAASTLVAMAADVGYDGPDEQFTLADLIDREHVEGLVEEALGLTDLAEKFLDQLTESPLVATMAARFVGRIMNDVVAANRAVAEKIPGVGSLVSFGANAAGKMMGAADKQFEQLLGDTAGKGAVFAMRRLNKVVVDTLKDPTTRDAVLEVYDLYADQPVVRLDQLGRRDDVHRVAGLLQDIVIAGAPTDAVLALVDALVDGFFAVYGDQPVTTLLEELDITRDDVVEHATAIVPGLLASVHESGELERLVRARLQPFFDSPKVRAILGA
jgi:hypothetical protein